MQADSDVAAHARLVAWERLATGVPGSWARREGGALGVMSGVELPGFNGVWSETADVQPGAVARLLDEIRSAGMPYCLQLRPGWPQEVDGVARERGLVRVEGEPVMHLTEPSRMDGFSVHSGLVVRELEPDEAGLHAQVAAAGGVVGGEAPYRKMASPGALRTPGIRGYVGEVHGEPVTTALGVTAGDCVGVFSVATVPSHRRRGYGAAITARAVRDGFSAGARWAWLAASPAGYRVYVRLGFVAVDRLDMWEPVRSRGLRS